MVITGDKISRDYDGFFWFIDREYRTRQSEVEGALLEQPVVQKTPAMRLSDRTRRLIVMLFVVLNKGMNPENSFSLASGLTRNGQPLSACS
jgi:acyl-coenzyme A synthetase/AMP-(fatty) acid ligase